MKKKYKDKKIVSYDDRSLGLRVESVSFRSETKREEDRRRDSLSVRVFESSLSPSISISAPSQGRKTNLSSREYRINRIRINNYEKLGRK